ncbi:MAG: hypothetical protein M1365_17375 [Actinobacteria bacterium]|nr:hypothetical protein [Actinomycetota bacterium]
MLDLIKLRKAPPMSKRMYLIKEMCESIGIDIEYLFGLFNMYNEKNKGKWFWQKASFGGHLKDVFDRFNSFMDKFVLKIKGYSDDDILRNFEDGKNLLCDLLKDLETNLAVGREIDGSTVRGYMDDNVRNLIQGSLKKIV